MKFTLHKLEFYTLEQKLLLTHVLNAPLRIRGGDLALTLEGLVNLGNPKMNATLVSKLYLELELQGVKQELIYEKNYKTKEVVVLLDNERKAETLAETLAQLLSREVADTWQGRVIDLRSTQDDVTKVIAQLEGQDTKITHLKSEITKVKTELGQTGELSPEEASKRKRINEVDARLKKLEGEVENYQNEKKNRDSLNDKLAKSEKELQTLGDKLASVDTLLEAKEKIEVGVQKFSAALSDQDVESKVKTLKQSRVEKYLQALMSFRPKSKNEVIQDESKPLNIFIAGKEVLGLLVLQIIVTIILFVVTLQARFIAIGFVASLVLIILFIVINLLKDKELGPINDLKLVDLEAEKENLLINTDPQENAFLINAAWLNALKLELKSINAMISSRFGEQTYEEVQAERERIQGELEQTKSELTELDVSTLSSEEYYKKRRELDILKIEKENLDLKAQDSGRPGADNGVRRLELERSLQDLEAQLESEQELVQSPPYFVVTADSSPIALPVVERQLVHIKVVD